MSRKSNEFVYHGVASLIEKVTPAWEKAQEQAKELLGSEFVSMLNSVARRASESNRA